MNAKLKRIQNVSILYVMAIVGLMFAAVVSQQCATIIVSNYKHVSVFDKLTISALIYLAFCTIPIFMEIAFKYEKPKKIVIYGLFGFLFIIFIAIYCIIAL